MYTIRGWLGTRGMQGILFCSGELWQACAEYRLSCRWRIGPQAERSATFVRGWGGHTHLSCVYLEKPWPTPFFHRQGNHSPPSICFGFEREKGSHSELIHNNLLEETCWHDKTFFKPKKPEEWVWGCFSFSKIHEIGGWGVGWSWDWKKPGQGNEVIYCTSHVLFLCF